MGRFRAMEIGLLLALVLATFASLHLVAAEVLTTVTPAFVWSDLRCVGLQDQGVNYESQTSEGLVETIFHDFTKCATRQVLGGEEAKPEMIVAFVGKELHSEDISQSHPSGILKTLQDAVAGAKYSQSIPYVTVASNRPSVVEYLLSNVQNANFKIGEVAVSGSCSVGRHGVKKLTDVPDIQAYIAGRKTSRVQEETDVLVICYSPSLDWDPAAISTSEGKVLDEVLSAVKSSSTSNVVMYFSDARVSKENYYGILDRHLLEGTGNSTGCDALCRSRAVILEGIFVALTLITILVSGICCMKAVKSPARFEVSKEQ